VTALTTDDVGSPRQAPVAESRRRGDRTLQLPPLLAILGRRLLLAVPLLLIVTVFSFVLVSFTPGDAAREILGTEATPETYANLRNELGLDRPVFAQYLTWLGGAVHGDLGRSIFTSQDVTRTITDRLPVTMSLVACSLIVSLLIGVALGVYSAVRGGAPAKIVDGLALVGFALPSVWLGAVLIGLFAVNLGWFRATGYVPLSESPTDWLRSLALPVAALALHAVAAVSKQTREAMLDVANSEYVRMARANGVSERSLIFRHTLKNAGLRIVTVLGLQAIGLLGGTVLVEAVFALPGLGGLAVEASRRHDLPVIQGVVLVFTCLVIAINLAIDVAYTWLNPRVSVR
jgi:peptide/nickel transport system permease protein